jgi:uncharacterized repeat protein (TIGR01451 family)
MLTHICNFNHKAWDNARANKIALAILIGGCLFSLCACVKQGRPTATPTDAPLPTRAAVSTPLPTSAPSSNLPPSTELGSPSAADLAIQIPGPVQIVPGEMTIYTLTVRNRGPSLATSIVLTDVLPAGVIPVWTQSAQPLCERQGRGVHCDVGDLQGSDTALVTLDLSVGGTEALVTGTQLAGVTLDLSAPTCAIEQDAAPHRVTCRLDKLQPGADAQMRIGVDVDARITGPLVHAATVTANETDPNSSNNQAMSTMTVGPPTALGTDAVEPVATAIIPTAVDLALQASGPTSIIAGRPFTYTFTVANRGALDAAGVSLEYVLPPATILDAYAPNLTLCEQQDDALTCALRDPGSGETITFTLVVAGHADQPLIIEPDPLTPGWPTCFLLKEETYLHIVACELGALKHGQETEVELTLITRALRDRMMVSTAFVSADEDEPNLLDNTNTMTIPVQVQADLSVSSAFSGPAAEDKTLSYVLTVTNIGPSDAIGVTLTDTLPIGAGLVSAVFGQGKDCRTEQENIVICSLGNLSGGETITTTMIVTVDEPLVHSVEVAAEQPDPDLGNNELLEPIPINLEPACPG